MSKSRYVAALALALLAPPCLATGDGATVVVTATRFPEAVADAPANITVITRAEIAHSPARSIPDLLKSVAGLDVRSYYGSMGIDAVVDLRGTGDAAASNALILVDGQRLNPVDMGSIKWETIPLSAIKRIEIMRGSGSVLYGDRATAGVIDIITEQNWKPQAGIRVEHGSFGYSAVDAHVGDSRHGWSGNLFAHDARTDGYRVNSDARQNSAGGRLARRLSAGEIFLGFSDYRERYGLPGALSSAQYQADPSQASTPNYRTEHHGYRLEPGASFSLGKDVSAMIDAGYNTDRTTTTNPDWFYRSRSRVHSLSLSPRIKWSHALAGAESGDTIAGVDFYDGKAATDSLDFSTGGLQDRQIGKQQTQGIYLRNRTTWANGVDVTAGLRREHFSQSVSDQSAQLYGQSSSDLTAWEFTAGYRFAAGDRAYRAYLKAARNFRLPNTDELFAYDPTTYQPIFNGALAPQTGQLVEAGLSSTGTRFMQQVTLFRQDNHNEIGYIAANGRNANLDPTRRQGLEWNARWHPSPAWLLRASVAAIHASFSDGPYAGKTIPLVPRHRESLDIQWQGGRAGTHDIALVSVGSSYFGGDFANTQGKLGGYTTLDYQGQWQIGDCSLIFRVTNLTDRKYSATGYSDTYYPANPRSLSVALKADLF